MATDWDRIVREHGSMVYGTAWRSWATRPTPRTWSRTCSCKSTSCSRRTRCAAGWRCCAGWRLAAPRPSAPGRKTTPLDGLQLAAATDAPDAALLERETSERLREAIAQLPRREGEVFCLRYLKTCRISKSRRRCRSRRAPRRPRCTRRGPSWRPCWSNPRRGNSRGREAEPAGRTPVRGRAGRRAAGRRRTGAHRAGPGRVAGPRRGTGARLGPGKVNPWVRYHRIATAAAAAALLLLTFGLLLVCWRFDPGRHAARRLFGRPALPPGKGDEGGINDVAVGADHVADPVRPDRGDGAAGERPFVDAERNPFRRSP